MTSLALIGLGYGDGEQLTLRGHRLLGESRWIGYFGLPLALAEPLGRYPATLVNLDLLLRSDLSPDGFTLRAAETALSAAYAYGHAAVAVSGHPAFANVATPVFAERAARAGVRFELVAAPSSLDAYCEQTGFDPISHGSTAIEARRFIERALTVDPRLTLILWSAGYLSGEERRRLATLLVASWGPSGRLSLYRAGSPSPGGGLLTYPLHRLDLWGPAVDYETTVIVPGVDFV